MNAFEWLEGACITRNSPLIIDALLYFISIRTNHLTGSYGKIYANQLTNRYDHLIELQTDLNSDNSIIRSYQIITDQIYICHLICRNHCVQQSPNHTDYLISTSNIELILFCVKCNFNQIYNNLNHSIFYSYMNLSRDSALFRIRTIEKFHQISINCINDKNQILVINGNFHLIDPNNNTQPFSCSINPMKIYPYHEEIILECEHFPTRADIIIWAITKLSKNFYKKFPKLLSLIKMMKKFVFYLIHYISRMKSSIQKFE